MSHEQEPPFTFTYRVGGAGWAEAELSSPERSITLTASYLSNALDDVLSAVESILDGDSDAEATWEEEPGHFRWVFTRTSSQVALVVFAGEETRRDGDAEYGEPQYWEAPARVASRASDLGPEFMIFEVRSGVDELARVIASAAADVLTREGELGYWEKWIESPFPTALLWRVQEKSGQARTPVPGPAPIAEDVRRRVLELWSDLVGGRKAPAAVMNDLWNSGLLDIPQPPVISQGLHWLDADVKLATIMPGAEHVARAHYESFRDGLELYDRDPDEWLRRAWMDHLAGRTEEVSRGRALKISEEYERFLSEADRRAAVARQGG